MPQKSHNCNLWMAYIHLFDTFPKICFWLMVDFLASGYYSVSCYFSIIHYFSLNRVLLLLYIIPLPLRIMLPYYCMTRRQRGRHVCVCV